ncbi:MAG: allophanate hydrolase [Rhodobacteraceae bacterium]|nr:allophanate hydrolase [Paracoccaceae bacterium]MAY44527.1 allophanate hydrolase [Paracoccaceae bacterium]QEW18233.1 Transcriptional activator ChrR [Marinibacterium anthonyi]
MLEPKITRDLLGGGWKDLDYEPFKPGIVAHWLLRGEPGIAILWYEPGACAPLHLHVDVETILVLDGSQSDEFGTYEKGDFVINPRGSQHAVHSEHGCVVLLTYTKPVRFL